MRGSSNLLILVVAVIQEEWRVSCQKLASKPFSLRKRSEDRPDSGRQWLGRVWRANRRKDVRQIDWPAQSSPEGAFASFAELTKEGRRIALSPLVRDEPIIASKVSAPDQRASLSTLIEKGKRAVTVAVDDVRGVAGFIFPGDFVDVALTRTESSKGPQNFSEVILQHVKVLAIDQMAGQRQEHPTVAKAVTVEVDPDQALQILLAANVGKLSLILRQPAEVALGPDAKVTDRDLFGDDEAQAQVSPANPSLPAVQAQPAVFQSDPSPGALPPGELPSRQELARRPHLPLRLAHTEDHRLSVG